jgi:hypothetical protein
MFFAALGPYITYRPVLQQRLLFAKDCQASLPHQLSRRVPCYDTMKTVIRKMRGHGHQEEMDDGIAGVPSSPVLKKEEDGVLSSLLPEKEWTNSLRSSTFSPRRKIAVNRSSQKLRSINHEPQSPPPLCRQSFGLGQQLKMSLESLPKLTELLEMCKMFLVSSTEDPQADQVKLHPRSRSLLRRCQSLQPTRHRSMCIQPCEWLLLHAKISSSTRRCLRD